MMGNNNNFAALEKIEDVLNLPGAEFIKDDLNTARDLLANGDALDSNGNVRSAVFNSCLNIAIINSETEVEALQWFLARLVQIETEETATETMAVILYVLSKKLPEAFDGLL